MSPELSPASTAAQAGAPESLSALLESLGLVGAADPDAPAAELPAGAAVPGAAKPMAAAAFACAVPELAVLRVSGADAVSFLQGQLTSDIAALAVGGAQWSALCSAKGRMLASFLVVRLDDALLLLPSRPLAAALAKRLRMFVLRAKVVIEERIDLLPLGVLGPASADALENARLALPDPMAAGADAVTVVGLTPVDVQDAAWPRALVLAEPADVTALWEALLGRARKVPSSWFVASEVLAGEARIVPATQEAFVPQMVNFELIGGVSFTKGCYTGQEVVARSQHLGKMKRRMLVFQGDKAATPGQDVLDGAHQVAGQVVASAPADILGQQGFVLLVETTVDGSNQAATDLQLDGTSLRPLPLPYPIPVHKPFVRPGA